jgi:hypothetical protein
MTLLQGLAVGSTAGLKAAASDLGRNVLKLALSDIEVTYIN